MAFALMVTSCTIDDDYPTEASSKSVVKVHFASTDVIVETAFLNSYYNLPVFVTEAIEGNSLIEYSINGVSYSTVLSSGALSTMIPINRGELGEFVVHIDRVTGTTETQNKVIDTDLDTVTVKITGPVTVVTTVGNVEVVLDWTSGEDLDLYFVDPSGNFALDYSWWDQPEGVTISGTVADDNYFILIDNYGAPAQFEVACTLTFYFPDGSSFVAIDGPIFEDTWIPFTKSTNGSEVTYVINI